MKPENLKSQALSHALQQADRKLTNLQTQILCCGTMLSTLALSADDEARVRAANAEYVAQYETARLEYVELAGERRSEFENLFTAMPSQLHAIAKQAHEDQTGNLKNELKSAVKQAISTLNVREQMIPKFSPPDLVLREGFFASDDPAYAHMPKAVANDQPWLGQELFLLALRYVETKAHKRAFKGWSDCRCCGQKNGSADYSRDRFGVKFVWPSGFSHYIAVHNIRPSLAFQDWVMAQYAIHKKKKSKKIVKTKMVARPSKAKK